VIVVRVLVVAVEAGVGKILGVHIGVADIRRQLFGQLDAEAGKDVVGERCVAVVEAVARRAGARVEQSGYARIDARGADANAKVRLDVTVSVEILDQVQHQRRRPGRTDARRTESAGRLRADEGVGNIEADVAIGYCALKAERVAEAVTKGEAVDRLDVRMRTAVNLAVCSGRSIDILNTIDNCAYSGGAVPSCLCMSGGACRHHGGGRCGAQKCFFHTVPLVQRSSPAPEQRSPEYGTRSPRILIPRYTVFFGLAIQAFLPRPQ